MSNYRKAGPARIPASTRRWVYRIAVAGAGVAIGYGVMTAAEGGLWLALAAAVLGAPSALAGANTPDED